METDDSSAEEYSESTDTDDSLPEVEDEIDPAIFEPLYNNATITKCGAFVAIMEFKRACRIPFSSIEKLLELLQLLCPADNSLPRTSYRLRTFFANQPASPPKNFCSVCLEEFVSGATKCANVNCLQLQPSTLSLCSPIKAMKRVMQSKLYIYIYN